jgi:hypothetical protein
VLLRNRHGIVAEQDVLADWIKTECLCGRRSSKFKAKDTVIICRTISVIVLELRL